MKPILKVRHSVLKRMKSSSQKRCFHPIGHSNIINPRGMIPLVFTVPRRLFGKYWHDEANIALNWGYCN